MSRARILTITLPGDTIVSINRSFSLVALRKRITGYIAALNFVVLLLVEELRSADFKNPNSATVSPRLTVTIETVH